MKTEFKIVKCVCCGKEIIDMFGKRKFCNKCRRYIGKLKARVSSLKTQLENANMKIYGAKTGYGRSQKCQS